MQDNVLLVFPARAGMNRTFRNPVGELRDVPRASGDEPDAIIVTITPNICSPRERG